LGTSSNYSNGGFSSHGADDTPPVKLILPITTRIQRKCKHDCNGKFYPIGIKTGFGGYTGHFLPVVMLVGCFPLYFGGDDVSNSETYF
jgi:hypothetical protein